ncbi:hypothetical protein [Embleya sp. NBC_00896]|uniref:hypothetical protein n=1 Tax=Embleya sp. NBC_00896 TaxID=2975961 RepID=UPI0038696867|nr:hypothetical protein OG928_23900 [Embleya sp. NBC_00896]
MRRHPDDTARGIVIPLAAIAIACLLLTSGVVLFSGSDGEPARGRTAAQGLDVPVPAVAPPARTSAAPSPPAPTTAKPTATRSATRTPSATATRTTTAPTTAPPATAGAKDISVDASVRDLGWGADGTVVITNRTSRPLPAWNLTLTATGKQSGFTMLVGANMRTSTDRDVATAQGTGPLAPGASTVISFGLYGRVESMGCTFTGVTCSVRGLHTNDR